MESKKKQQSIAVKLAKISVAIAFVLGSLFSAAQVYQDFQYEQQLIDQSIHKILQIAERSASASILYLSEDLALEVVIGLAEYDFITRAIILDDFGNILADTGQVAHLESATHGLSHYFTDDHLEFSIELYPSFDKLVKPGKLTVSIHVDTALSAFYQRSILIFINGLIRNLVLALMLFGAFYWIIARPLQKLSDSFKQAGTMTEELPLIQVPAGHENDELGRLSQDANKFLQDSQQYMQALKSTEQRFRNLVEGSLQGICVLDDFKPLFVNQRYAEIFGYDIPAEILQLDSILKTLVVEEDREVIAGYRKARIAGNTYPTNFELQGKRKDGSVIWLESNITEIDWQGRQVIQMVVVDITKRKEATENLTYQASHDALTGLINRREFELRTNHLLKTSCDENAEHAMCFLDLDQFKVINDTCGHAAGDELLRQVATLLKKTVSKRDTLARLGGDEFGLLMEACPLDQAKRVAESILEAIKQHSFLWSGKVFHFGVSIGLVVIDESTGNFNELFKQVDSACYLAKEQGRNRIYTYHPNDADMAIRQGEMQWVGRINQAIEQNQFCLYAQPIVPLNNDSGRHYELLLRMLDEQGSIIAPGEFLPAAERYNLIGRLDAWVVDHACNLLADNPVFIEQIEFISINLSGPSLTNVEFLEIIKQKIRASNIPPGKICFEVTETVAVSNLALAAEFISSLKVFGCRFALDDFGSGLSSFGYLKHLPIDYLKIDGIFVKDIVDDPIDFAMVKSINEIGQVMGLQTIAEFVETDEIKEKLEAIGVNFAQGYGVGKPEPVQNLLNDLKGI